jgi:hypothetical protein
VLCLGLLAGSSAHADVIVDQPFNTNTSVLSQDSTDSPDVSNFAFDDFTTAIAFNLTTLTVFGDGEPVFNTTGVIGQIWSDLPGSFGGSSILSVSGTPVGEDLVFDFGGQLLPAGSYWLTAYLERSGSLAPWLWGTHLPVSGSELYFYSPGGGFSWGTDPVPIGSIPDSFGSFDAAFRLEGEPVPEPATFVLVALGLAGLGFVALRKKFRRA